MTVLKHKAPILSQIAVEVESHEFGEDLDLGMSEMLKTMYTLQGVGLAANQVGFDRRILVADLGYVNGEDYGSNNIKVVNPVIVSYSEEEEEAQEGCLSFPGLAKTVSRPLAINLRYQDPFGEIKEQIFKGWQARILCHEINHLDGQTLYTRLSRTAKARYDKKFKKLMLKK